MGMLEIPQGAGLSPAHGGHWCTGLVDGVQGYQIPKQGQLPDGDVGKVERYPWVIFSVVFYQKTNSMFRIQYTHIWGPQQSISYAISGLSVQHSLGLKSMFCTLNNLIYY